MKKWILLTLAVAIPAFIIHPLVFKMPAGSMEPTSAQLPFFILLTIIESLAMGLAVSFVIFSNGIVSKAPKDSKMLSRKLQLSIAWVLGNWWVHDGLHMINGTNLQGLLFIEYGFHVTLIIAACIIAYCFLKPVSKNML